MKQKSAQYVLLASVLLLGVVWWAGQMPLLLAFKPKLATEIVPGLLTGLFVIAAVSERAIAVLNDIWFGESRENQQELVRAKGKELESVLSSSRATLDMHSKIAIEAARAGSIPPLTAESIAAITSSNAGFPAARIEAICADLAVQNQTLVTVDAKADRTRLSLAFVASLLVAFVGVRVLDSLLEGTHPPLFQFVDIVLTAGVLAGGTTAINAISELLGGYLNASRKRALEGS
ncbi:hypothetical protein [Rhizobium herbae]|uniref:DUF697 domain-containing protein n=1 Tax=Rhizobium herbae TaxID=508661 RepID=A0ABS4EUA8_9HYPH|nr:hypothetical protein [Rhizobium herbae]MBP1861544.1 hypothetical protein [Rhizobium herbae]